MPVPSSISDLSTTPSLNSPAGTESPSTVDDYLRTHAAFIKQVDGGAVKAEGLAATGGSALVGYDGGTVQAVLDEAKPMANYTALRNYTGRATGVRITQSGLAGFFRRDDADTTSADNGGTTIVDASGLRWKRLVDGWVNVKWFEAVGDGSADDLAKLIKARDAAAAVLKTLYFPAGEYGISDRFMFADGGDAFFEPGATIKLLTNTQPGGAVSGPYPTQTMPIQVHNLTVDCNNFAGENGIGFGHIIGAKLVNLTVKNCVHSTTAFGGKALQFEGIPATNVQVLGFSAENCTVGIDIGAHTPNGSGQTVHISISNVSMKNVDIPVYVNDTNTLTAPDSFDAVEVLIDGLHCRNCGRLKYSGATATDGGIFVADRGYKLTARNVVVVNDRGTYGSTAYGGIGALTRGAFKGLILDDVLIDADCTALFDFNISTFQSANNAQTGMYILANNVRYYGNLDYVVKGPTGDSRIGPCRLEGVEIGSSAATLAGLLEAPVHAYTGAVLEVIDRDNAFQSTGLRTFNRLAAMGNTLSSAGMIGKKAQAIASGSWTPIDGSTAGLAFTGVSGAWFRLGEMVVAYGAATYPTTADTAAAKLGGLPFTLENSAQARATGILTVSSKAGVQQLYPELNSNVAPLLSGSGAGVTNADCSGGFFTFMFIYPAKA